ncbi:MAG: hypothetical protein NVS3B19_10150 [Ginsengibacter sp.]
MGAAGRGLTITFVVVGNELHPFTDVIKEYVPAFADDILLITKLCKEETKPLGPIQRYAAPEITVDDKYRSAPSHNGPLLDATPDDGVGLTVTSVDTGNELQPLTVTNKL